jgi:nucleotide-binding universal stress UspA family protein
MGRDYPRQTKLALIHVNTEKDKSPYAEASCPHPEMTMYKHILVATDGSELSQLAVTSGIDLAVLTKADLTIVKIVPHYARTYFEGAMTISLHESERIEKQWADDAQAIVDASKATAEAQGITAYAIVVKSDLIAEGIITAATDCAADLIVMASHGRRGLKRLLLGSETQQVLTHSHTPVLVLR